MFYCIAYFWEFLHIVQFLSINIIETWYQKHNVKKKEQKQEEIK